ncbi:MAG: 3'-5' exonuclease, partial [Clostridia bacterium]
SYFSFAYIKRLLYEKDLTAVAELSHNYRNTKKIVEIISQLCAINEKQFGTHSFVWRGESVDSDIKTRAVYVAGQNFVNALSRQNIDNFTVIVSTKQEKDELRKSLKTQEILTVSEVKGLERDTVLLYNVLSKNIDKWRTLERVSLNRKQADENSVFRYYFNLFYVGVSRAKINLYVCEDEKIQLFDEFFADNFAKNSPQEAINGLADAVGRAETEQEELLDRVEQFVKLEQFDNARFTANKINDDIARTYWLNKTDIAEKFILHGNYRDAGIKFWELEMYDDAKIQFGLSGDEKLCELVDACLENNKQGLSIDIIQFFNAVEGNDVARKLIIETVQKDLSQILSKQKELNSKFKKIKERKNG